MVKRKKKYIKRNTSERKIKNGIFSKINLNESYTSLILGAIIVVVIGILFLSFAKIDKNIQTSSVMDIKKIEELNPQSSNVSSTYTIRPGDDLWTISQNIYNDGYKWVEIAKLNKLENPGLIYSGDKLIISTKVQEEQVETNTQVQATAGRNLTEKKSITGEMYTIEKGDCLWNIAVRAYGDGYRWPEIARINSLDNPDLIFSGNVLKIPR